MEMFTIVPTIFYIGGGLVIEDIRKDEPDIVATVLEDYEESETK